jgi:branched-subunit amino acid transport protein
MNTALSAYTEGQIWLLILACGLLTVAIRASFIFAQGHYSAPGWFRALMPFVPIATLSALTLPDIALAAGGLDLSFANAKLWAGIVAIAVAAKWKNILLTIGAGFAALVLIRAVTAAG